MYTSIHVLMKVKHNTCTMYVLKIQAASLRQICYICDYMGMRVKMMQTRAISVVYGRLLALEVVYPNYSSIYLYVYI